MENDMSYTTTNRIIIDMETSPQKRLRQKQTACKVAGNHRDSRLTGRRGFVFWNLLTSEG